MTLPPKLPPTLGELFASATRGAWSLDRVRHERGRLLLDAHGAEGTFAVEVVRDGPSVRSYRALGGFAFSYRTGTASPRLPLLSATIEALARALTEAAFDVEATPAHGERAASEARPAPDAEAAPASTTTAAAHGAHGAQARQDDEAPAFPTPYHRYELERPLALRAEQLAAFARDGHLLVRGALDRGVVLSARQAAVAAVAARTPREASEPTDAYARAFTQITNIGLEDAAIRALAHAPRLARMAADLLGVPAVRIFCEDWLIKEPRAPITPWHQDGAVMPFDAERSITAWIPLQPVADNGRLRFARGSHLGGLQPIENISDESEAQFDAILRARGWPVVLGPDMLAGDVSFHHGSTVHGALPNPSDARRIALAIHYFADGARLVAPRTTAMRKVRDLFGPGLADGEPAASPAWPRIEATFERSTAQPLHLRARLLEGPGEPAAPTDLWIHDGRLRRSPMEGARTLSSTGFVGNGLVDFHTHLSWPHTPPMEQPVQTRAHMNALRARYAASGVLAVRDMGSATDHVNALGDEPGLARVRASGMIVVPYGGFPFTESPPTQLTRAFLERLARGATWIKVFTDWSSDWGGEDRTGFAGWNRVTYPLEVLAEAVTAAHALGARVAAHCFTREGAEVAVRAGVDTLEHGWGVDDALLGEMAERGVGWVPLVGIASNMWRAAARDAQGARIDWLERSLAQLQETLARAEASGVTLLAGTDWFPDVTVVDEVRELVALGLSTETAVGAATWGARRSLGEPTFEDGAPADLVLYDQDPRVDLEVLERPSQILLGGRAIAPSREGLRPSFTPWSRRAELAEPRSAGA